MDEQKGFFGLLDRYLMEPMGKLASYKVVRAITAAGMAAVPLLLSALCSRCLVFCHKPSRFGQLLQMFLQRHLINSLPFIW